MKKQTIVVALVKQTKGTYVYAADEAVCTQIYLRKADVGKEPPPMIRLTIEEVGTEENPVDADALLTDMLNAEKVA